MNTTILRIVILLTFCYPHAQVKKHDKVKKVKRNTYNFISENNCLNKKQKKDKRVLTVYSDTHNNIAYLDPLGLQQGEKQPFLAPFYVISKKDDYYEVVKKNPKELGKPKGIFSFLRNSKYAFKDAGNVTYVGWIHKDRLLHFSNPDYSTSNFKPKQYIIGYGDIPTLLHLKKHANKDTVFVYKDPNLTTKSDKMLHANQFVYLYKYNTNKTAALVSNVANMTEADKPKRKMGWVPATLIQPVGQRNVINIPNNKNFKLYKNDTIITQAVLGREIANNYVFKNHSCSAKTDSLSPVTVPLEIWDHYNNTLINVKGNDFLIREIDSIKKEQQNIHFHFVFDCSAHLRKELLLQINGLQHIGMLIAEDQRFKDKSITYSASSYGCNKMYSLEKTTSFTKWIDFLKNAFSGTIPATGINQKGIVECFDAALRNTRKPLNFQNNIIIVTGDQSMTFPRLKNNASIYDLEVFKELSKSSTKLLFVQLKNDLGDSYQEYLLQAKGILDYVGTKHTNYLKNYIVENKLVKSSNIFTRAEFKEKQDNLYFYDSPKNSLFVGALIFPKIRQPLLPTSFDIAIDSIVNKMFSVNNVLISSLEKNAQELGFLRSATSQSVENIFKEDKKHKDALVLIPRNFYNETFYTTQFTHKVTDSLFKTGYLLNKEELSLLIQNYRSLIPLPEKSKKAHRRKLKKIYKKNVRLINKYLYYKVLKRKDPIADLLYIKSGIRAENEVLNTIRLKKIHKKNKLSEQEYIETMSELREKITNLEAILNGEDKAEYKDGSKQSYFFITNDKLL